MKLKVPDSILAIAPYVPGKPIEALEREYGIVDSVKLASNENPLGPSPMAVDAVAKCLAGLHRYPDGAGHMLVAKLAEKLGVAPENVVIGNGSDDIIGMLATAFLRPGDEAVMPKPSFLMYDIAVKSAGATSVAVPLSGLAIDLDAIKEAISEKTRMIFICNPNNPTGTALLKDELDGFIKGISQDIIVVVDEAYIEFASSPDCVSAVQYARSHRPVVTLRTFSKLYGLAGLRVGYGVMPQAVAEILNRVRHPFNVNSLAQAGALAALDDISYTEKTLKLVHGGIADLCQGLDAIGVSYFPTQTNFFLVDVKMAADAVFEKMLTLGVIIRSMTSYDFPEYIRVTVGTEAENRRFLDALKQVVKK